MIFCKMTLEKMSSWQNDFWKLNDHLAKWPMDKIAFGKMTFAKIFSWQNKFHQNSQLTKWLYKKWAVDKMSWQNDQLTKWPVDKMTFAKMTFRKMTSWQNDFWQNDMAPKRI